MRQILWAIGLFVYFVLAANQVGAAVPLQIWPIDPVISHQKNSAVLWLQNNGSEDAVMQVRIVRWKQVDGQDQYEAQSNVIASPPIMKLQPNIRQMVRLIHKGPRASGETAYRIILDEVPVQKPMLADAQDAEVSETASPPGISFHMRFLLPLFVYDWGTLEKGKRILAQADLQCRYRTDKTGVTLSIANMGNMHARIVDPKVQAGGKTYGLGDGLSGYIMPGSRMDKQIAGLTEKITRFSVQGTGGVGRTEVDNCTLA